jgi:DNA-directed RNA polymerase subunit M/transcription elongation factor TFIIS
MSIIVECTGCKNQFYALQTAAGKIARCPQCSQKISIPNPALTVPVPNKAASVSSTKPATVPRSTRSAAAKSSAAVAAVKNPKPNEQRADIEPKQTRLKIPRVSRGMRWFLIIVVGPLVGIYLLGEIVPPVLRLFRGTPTPASSGTFGPTPEEREALLQQLADEEQRQAAKNTAGDIQAASSPKPELLLLNGDSFSMTPKSFMEKYRGYYTPGIYLDLRGFKDRGTIEESYHYHPGRTGELKAGNIPAFSWTYEFLDHKLVKLHGLLKTENSASLIVALNKYFKAPPKQITEYKKFLEPGNLDENDTRPQLRWQNDQLRITLTPTVADCYDYEVVESSLATTEAK